MEGILRQIVDSVEIACGEHFPQTFAQKVLKEICLSRQSNLNLGSTRRVSLVFARFWHRQDSGFGLSHSRTLFPANHFLQEGDEILQGN